ncbi:MAG: response regulator [Azospirillum sp.]|nr:response regulator [Azospirillum sp.]
MTAAADVLIADDEPAFRRLAQRWLEGAGHRVVVAATGDQALARFRAGGIGLVVLDLVMPPALRPEDGLTLIPSFAGVPVIVLTGHADHALALRAIEAGAWDFLGKPADPDMLRFVVARALAKNTLERELAELRARIGGDALGILGISPAIERLRGLVRRIAPSEVPVLIQGPSGTGKELVARGLHSLSPRRAAPFLAVHCGAIPAELLESELFGHLKGSFTGADRDRPGLVETAHGGVLFLDEIGEMPPAMQVKLLRLLQDGSYLPVGGRQSRQADLRIVSATHRDLAAMVASGHFREDLYYRLKGIVLRTPALAEHVEDVAVLAGAFLGAATGGRRLRLTAAALAWLTAQSWPGNVRELQATLRTAAALAPASPVGETALDAADLAFARFGDTATGIGAEPNDGYDCTLPAQVAALERRLITEALAATANNHSRTARRLGISRIGLLNKLDRLGLRKPSPDPVGPPVDPDSDL